MAGGAAQILLKITKAKPQTPKKTQRLRVFFPADWPLGISLAFGFWDLAFNRKGGQTMPDRLRGATNYWLFVWRS
jgi:hypothetical protein